MTDVGPPQERRTDAGSRKIIERLDTHAERMDGLEVLVKAHRDELEQMARKVPNLVTYGWLVPIIGTAALAIITAVWTVMGGTREEVRAARKESAEDARQLRQETSSTVQRIETKVDALYRSTIEGRPKAQVRAETERAVEESQVRQEKAKRQQQKEAPHE